MSHRRRTSALGALAAFFLVPLLAGCGTATEAEGEAVENPTSAPVVDHQESSDEDPIEAIDLDEWRDRARAAAFGGDPLHGECADVYPDSITERIAEFVGPDVFGTETSGLLHSPSLICTFTAEFEGYGGGDIELTTEFESPECDDITPGVEGITAIPLLEGDSASSASAMGCSAAGTYHSVDVIALAEEPRLVHATDTAFIEETVAALIEGEDEFVEQALEIHAQLE